MSQTPRNPRVVEATGENFQREVIDRSYEVPVVVDFWAEWCGPCRALSPVLERLAAEYGGKFVLVKADTETLPEIAGAFGVRSIPAVFGLRDGKVIDAFLGALPEADVRRWLDRLMPSPAEQIAAEAQGLEDDDPKAAELRYRAALELEPDSQAAMLGLARVAVRQGRFDDARARVRDLESRGYLDARLDAVKAELELKEQASDTGGVDAARTALAAQPGDPELRLKLAEALAAAGRHEEALETALALVEEHRKDTSETARQLMLNVFQVLPPESEMVNEFRRRLSMALY
jgi:putative thioredoxin